jgi:hypothetical protein
MLKELTSVDQDAAFAKGILEGWLSGKLPPVAPPQILAYLKDLTDGLDSYRERYLVVQEDYSTLLERYNALTVQAAQYLEFSRQQKEQLDEYLLEGQREFHQKERV